MSHSFAIVSDASLRNLHFTGLEFGNVGFV